MQGDMDVIDAIKFQLVGYLAILQKNFRSQIRLDGSALVITVPFRFN